MYRNIAKIGYNDHLGSNNDQCYFQNHVIKRSRCIAPDRLQCFTVALPESFIYVFFSFLRENMN